MLLPKQDVTPLINGGGWRSVFAHAAGGLVLATPSTIYYTPDASTAPAAVTDASAVEVAAAGNRVWWLTRQGAVDSATWHMGCAAGFKANHDGACMQVGHGWYSTNGLDIQTCPRSVAPPLAPSVAHPLVQAYAPTDTGGPTV